MSFAANGNDFSFLLGVVFGSIGDRIGYRKLMITGMLLGIRMLADGFFPLYGVVLIAYFMAGQGKSILDPAVQAYISERVPYRRRGMAIGLMEISWAGNTLLGIPLIALLIGGGAFTIYVMGTIGILGALAAVLKRQ